MSPDRGVHRSLVHTLRTGPFLLLLAACGEDSTGPSAVPAHITPVSGAIQTSAVGAVLDSALAVRVTDAGDKPISGVLVKFSLPAGAGTLSLLSTTTDPSGIARTRWTLPPTAGSYAVHATAASLDSIAFTAVAAPGPPAQLIIVSGDTVAGTAGKSLDSSIVVKLRDNFGNPVARVPLTFGTTAGSVSAQSAVTDPQGEARVQWTLGPAFGIAKLVVSGPGLVPDSITGFGFPPADHRIAVGASDSCRIEPDGSAACWGAGSGGLLGTGDTVAHFTPAPVAGAVTFRSVTAGSGLSCGLGLLGEAYCWGPGLGLSPQLVSGGLSFNALSAGAEHACGVTPSGAGYCWGYNLNGQLGDGTRADRGSPTPVSGGIRFREISAGYEHSCGISITALAYCWGTNTTGGLGIGSLSDAIVPRPVAGSHRFASIGAGGGFSCGLALSGDGWCWGSGQRGALGIGTMPPQPVPTPMQVAGGHHFSRLSVGGGHVCALEETQAFCWGDNAVAQLGSLAFQPQAAPIAVPNSPALADISAGKLGTSCALSTSAQTYCWGSNASGQVGVGQTDRSTAPVTPAGAPVLTMVSAGYDHTCGLTANGSAYCWGANDHGQLGDGTQYIRFSPTPVSGGLQFRSIVAGNAATCALGNDSTAYCWGQNNAGQLGDSSQTDRLLPKPVAGGLKFTELAGPAILHACGVASTGEGRCWGFNGKGQLGDSTRTDADHPVLVADGSAFASVRPGYEFTCGLTAAGAAYCWGEGLAAAGANPGGSMVPMPVSGGLSFSSLAAGRDHACGVTSAGQLYCWGSNSLNQLGDGGSAGSTVPVPVQGGGSFASVESGGQSSCGLTTGGQAYCWGYNGMGQLGDGSVVNRPVPVPTATTEQFSHISVGFLHVCGIATSGTTLCWGYNNAGQLGLGYGSSVPTPTLVP